MTKAQAQVMKRWAKALRSGKYKQARSQLKKGDRYCCLGVLCDIVDPSRKTAWYDDDLYPTDAVIRRAGLRLAGLDADHFDFTDLNDQGRATFEEIADVVDWIRLSDA